MNTHWTYKSSLFLLVRPLMLTQPSWTPLFELRMKIHLTQYYFNYLFQEGSFFFFDRMCLCTCVLDWRSTLLKVWKWCHVIFFLHQIGYRPKLMVLKQLKNKHTKQTNWNFIMCWNGRNIFLRSIFRLLMGRHSLVSVWETLMLHKCPVQQSLCNTQSNILHGTVESMPHIALIHRFMYDCDKLGH